MQQSLASKERRDFIGGSTLGTCGVWGMEAGDWGPGERGKRFPLRQTFRRNWDYIEGTGVFSSTIHSFFHSYPT
jgi:hypothetical protein